MRPIHRAALVLLVAQSVMVSGCAPLLPTALVLRIESDIPLTSVRVVARRGDASPFFTREFTIGPDFTLPGMLTLVPRDPSDPRAVVIEVDAVVAASGRTLRNLYVARFLPERTQMIRVALSGRCDVDAPLCASRTQNCTASGCENAAPARTIDVTADRCSREGERLTRCGDTCADLQSDPDHCGRCERRCPGVLPWLRACVAGACESRDPRVLACPSAPILTDRAVVGQTEMTLPMDCEPFGTAGSKVFTVEVRPRSRTQVVVEQLGLADVAVHRHLSCETIAELCSENVVTGSVGGAATIVIGQRMIDAVQRFPVSVTTRARYCKLSHLCARLSVCGQRGLCWRSGVDRRTPGVG